MDAGVRDPFGHRAVITPADSAVGETADKAVQKEAFVENGSIYLFSRNLPVAMSTRTVECEP